MTPTKAKVLAHPARPAEVRCSCGFSVFDGDVVRARVVRLVDGGAGAEAKCRCKQWVRVPLMYSDCAHAVGCQTSQGYR